MFITTLKKKYITLIVIISILTGVNTTLAAYQTDVISDMALIYQGGTHRPEWTEVNYVLCHTYFCRWTYGLVFRLFFIF